MRRTETKWVANRLQREFEQELAKDMVRFGELLDKAERQGGVDVVWRMYPHLEFEKFVKHTLPKLSENFPSVLLAFELKNTRRNERDAKAEANYLRKLEAKRLRDKEFDILQNGTLAEQSEVWRQRHIRKLEARALHLSSQNFEPDR